MNSLIPDYYELQPLVDKFICRDCVEESYLRSIVTSQGVDHTGCSYCFESNRRVVDMNIIVDVVQKALLAEYDDAQMLDCSWEAWPEGESTSEVLSEFCPGWSASVFEDICNSIGYDICWVPHADGSVWRERKDSALVDAYTRFVEFAQKNPLDRFPFLGQAIDVQSKHGGGAISFYQVFKELTKLIIQLGLITTIPSGSCLYRAHYRKGRTFKNSCDYLMPPKNMIKPGRMNVANQPVLYSGIDCDTALAETHHNGRKPGTHILAKLSVVKDLSIINLANMPEAPSYFDYKKVNIRFGVYFLNRFVEEISKPKGTGHYQDYYSTQILSDYLRGWSTSLNPQVYGLQFRSSKAQSGVNQALFFNSNANVLNFLKVSSAAVT